jgi:uncharacterized membrane protein YjjP (DUF1212 family)
VAEPKQEHLPSASTTTAPDWHASESLQAATEALTMAFIVRLAQALHRYGAPGHRLEQALVEFAKRLDTVAEVFCTPTSLMVAIGRDDRQRLHMIRAEPGGVDLGRLVELDALLYQFSLSPVDLASAHARLDAILAAPSRYGKWLPTWSTAVAAAGAAVMFGGRCNETIFAGILGAMTDLIARFTDARADARHIFEPIACFMVAFVGYFAVRLIAPGSDHIITLAALVVMFPGLSLTVALTELATRHLVSGTARLAGVMTVFLTMTFGVALARQLGPILSIHAHPFFTSNPELPSYAQWIALGLAPPAFVVLFRARAQDAPVIVANAVFGFLVARFSGHALGPELGAFLGALSVGFGGNTYARLAGRPSSVAILSGLLLLVPGSVGFRSLNFFLTQDFTAGLRTAFETAILATCLVGGILSANVFLPPKRAL